MKGEEYSWLYQRSELLWEGEIVHQKHEETGISSLLGYIQLFTTLIHSMSERALVSKTKTHISVVFLCPNQSADITS